MSLVYGTSTALTITAGSLLSGANRSSAAVTTNATVNTAQIMLTVSVLTGAIAPAGNKQVVVYGYMSEDGTNYSSNSVTSDNVDGTDKALTAVGSPSNLKFIGVVSLPATAAATAKATFEVTATFGCIPRKWGIVLVNDCGQTLGATIGATYSEVSYS